MLLHSIVSDRDPNSSYEAIHSATTRTMSHPNVIFFITKKSYGARKLFGRHFIVTQKVELSPCIIDTLIYIL